MYTLVGILLALVVLGQFVSIYLKHRRKIHEAKGWLASQPPEVIISGRKRAAERGRALLEEQIDFDTFSKEFRQSQDPEIKNLVEIADVFFHEWNWDQFGSWDDFQSVFRDSIEKLEKGILVLERKG